MKTFQYILTSVLLCLSIFQPGAAVAADEDSGWKSISDPRLTVRFHGPSDVLANQVLERAGTFLTDTSEFLGLPWVGSYSIVLAGSRDEFVKLQHTTKPAPEWAGALTYPGLGMVLIMTPGAMESGGSRYWSILQHEMAHLLLGDAESRHDTRLPRWFQEGVATFVSGEMNLSRLVQLGWAQATGATPDFRELEFTFPNQASQAGAAYARSYLFIKYISQRFGQDAVARLVSESLQRDGINRGAVAAFDNRTPCPRRHVETPQRADRDRGVDGKFIPAAERHRHVGAGRGELGTAEPVLRDPRLQPRPLRVPHRRFDGQSVSHARRAAEGDG